MSASAAQTREATTESPSDPSRTSVRRRDKLQLSCNACRRRKVRCDRIHPCSNCASRGLGASCSYPNNSLVSRPTATNPPNASNTHSMLQDRINHLESLLGRLMQQTVPGSRPSSHLLEDASDTISSNHLLLGPSPRGSDLTISETQHDISPSPSEHEHGSIRIQQTGVSYVNSTHWAAVLDGIAELKSHVADDDDEPQSSHYSHLDQSQAALPKPQLLYGCMSLMRETPVSILRSIPPRPVVDRLVSRYFNALDIAPGVVHSRQFLREYEEFWKSPQAAPVTWVGLLFSIMCLSTQFQQAFLAPTPGFPTNPHSSESEATVDAFRDKVTQCLMLGHYTRGGPYVLETLIFYFLIEVLHLKDMEIGIWVLVGNIVQVAIHMGYHRDAKHFPNISPFAGEMRRRVWAMIVQLDFSTSTQLGLPRLIKETQADTTEPRNLNDSDFDEHTAELPPSRPETDVTPMLYVLAKIRLQSVGVKVADVATEPRSHSYAEIMELDHQINEAKDALPSSLKWRGLASSLNMSSQIIIQAIWLEVIVQQLKIVLHRKFLEPCRFQPEYTSSRSTCLSAAMAILELQHLIDEETQVDGLLYPSRWRVSSAFFNDFLLATSVLCFYLQAHDTNHRQESDTISAGDEADLLDRVKQLLSKSRVIWSRQATVSREARKAAAAVRFVLGDNEQVHGSEDIIPDPIPVSAVSYFSDVMTDYHGLLDQEQEFRNGGMPWQSLVSNWTNWNNNDVEQWVGQTGPS